MISTVFTELSSVPHALTLEWDVIVVHLYVTLRIGKSIEMDKNEWSPVARDERAEQGRSAAGYRVSFWGDMHILT